AAGIGILDRLEERGRDPRALLDQVVDAVRAGLVREAMSGATDRGAALAAAARRLTAIDPDRAGIGGLRLQLELALFAAGPSPAPATTTQRTTAPSTAEGPNGPARPQGPTPTQPRSARASVASPAPAAAPSPDATAAPPAPDATAAAPDATAAAPAQEAASPAPESTSPARKEAAPEPDAAAPESAAESPATAAATPVADANGTELSLEGVVAAWPAIVAVLSTQPAIKQLILTCRPVALDGVVVTLGYPEEQAFLREIAERKKANIEAGIREVIGHDVGVRCVVANIEVAAPAAGGDDGFLMAEARRIFGDDLAEVVEID
ncbi:MAG TPA: hypothetical protein VM408_05885, partial [Methylomirabilota bacterium]|nr:hypothetical protein [Methylomirabilota bacterium]